MIDWIKKRFAYVGGAVSDLRDRTVEAFLTVWGLLTTLFMLIHLVWSALGNAAASLRDTLFSLARSVYDVVRTIILVRIPNALRIAFHDASQFVTAVVNTVKNGILAVVHTLESWAHAAVSFVSSVLNSFINWATRTVAGILATLGHVAFIVANLLTDPAALVRWFIAALWKEAFNYLFAKRETIARWMLARAVSASMFAIQVIEELIVRVL